MLFDNLLERVASEVPEQPKEPRLYSNPIFNAKMLVGILESGEISQQDLYAVVKESYKSILDEIFHNNDTSYAYLFTFPKFLSTLADVINSSPVDLTENERLYCNKISYDYITWNSDIRSNRKDEVVSLFFNLSKVVNKKLIPTLIGIGLNEEVASYLVLSRHSSFDETVNVKRLNFVIINQPMELMTMEIIIRIYQRLFTKMTTLFETIMFDTTTVNEDDPNITDDMMELNATIDLAVLAMLEVMPIADIKHVLSSYACNYKYLYANGTHTKPIRFSMRCISEDYPRIIASVNQLDAEHVYVP